MNELPLQWLGAEQHEKRMTTSYCNTDEKIISVHLKDNNPESQKKLDENRWHFSKQCMLIFDYLAMGEELTSLSAIEKFKIMHLARRVLDIKEQGFVINDRWDGRVKAWYMDKESKEYNLNKLSEE